MADISNRTLVGLLVVAIVVSLAGTFVSLNKLGTISSISGAATNGTGTVLLEVQQNAELTLQINTLFFGSGRINGSAPGFQFCDLVSNITAAMGGNTFTPAAATLGANCVSFVAPNQSFVVENTGNIPFTNVTVNSSNAQVFAPILGGNLAVNGTYSYKAHEEGDACSNFATAPATFTLFDTVPTRVCSNFTAAPATANAFALQVNLSLPETANSTGGANATDSISFIGII